MNGHLAGHFRPPALYQHQPLPVVSKKPYHHFQNGTSGLTSKVSSALNNSLNNHNNNINNNHNNNNNNHTNLYYTNHTTSGFGPQALALVNGNGTIQHLRPHLNGSVHTNGHTTGSVHMNGSAHSNGHATGSVHTNEHANGHTAGSVHTTGSVHTNGSAHTNGTGHRPTVRVLLNPQANSSFPLPGSGANSFFRSQTLLSQPLTVGSLWCWACCCCLAPAWYQAHCNIYRVIALICNLFVNLLMILCLLSTNWLTTTKYRQGLWQYCIDEGSPRPLPFGIEAHDGCHWGRDAAYIRLAGFFALACFFLSIIATVLTSFGLSSRDPNRKYTFYRFALYINLAALLSVIVALTLYPAFFYTELHHTSAVPANRPHWYFGWAYGVGWGSAIFLIGAVLLLVCDKETEEIYYKERTVVQANGNHHHLPNPYQQQAQHQQLLRNQNQMMYMMPPQMVKT